MQVHDLAKLLHRAHQLALNAARPLREQRDFSRVDWDAWWQMNADMPLSGPGFVKLWTDCATEVFSAIATEPTAPGHPDDLAVNRFAAEMKAKLAKKRAEGRGGWEDPDECSIEALSYMLIQHIWKGDPIDVGNLAMMIQQRGGKIVIDDETLPIALSAPAEQAATEWPRGTRIRVKHDGFEGVTLGPYVTLEGKRGQVCQLAGAQVVHVYGEKWLQRTGEINAAPATSAARPLEEWHEDHGFAVWWTWQDGDWLGEPSYIGSPLCGDWPGYHTHWTPHPAFPVPLAGA